MELEFPEDLRYTNEHEWARAEGSRVRVGITDFAQDALGDVVYVDLPDVGAAVEADRPFGEVESTKSVSDVYSPLSGTIAERNPLLDERPELVNEQPYADGWLVVIEPADLGAVERLMDVAAYRSFLDRAGRSSPLNVGSAVDPGSRLRPANARGLDSHAVEGSHELR